MGSALKNRCWNTCLFWLLPYIPKLLLSWRETQYVPPGTGEWGQESGAGSPASSCWWKRELMRSWPCGPAVRSQSVSQLCVCTHTHDLQRELLASNVSFYFLDTQHGHQIGFHDVTHPWPSDLVKPSVFLWDEWRARQRWPTNCSELWLGLTHYCCSDS